MELLAIEVHIGIVAVTDLVGFDVRVCEVLPHKGFVI